MRCVRQADLSSASPMPSSHCRRTISRRAVAEKRPASAIALVLERNREDARASRFLGLLVGPLR
jgi:hypothetical protein